MAASEATPFSKTGGLADVTGALPAALAAQGEQVTVVTPIYDPANPAVAASSEIYRNLRVWIGTSPIDVNIRRVERDGVTWLLLECPSAFERKRLYGESDDHIRFAVLCHAVLGIVRRLVRPDVIHLHDWQTGLIPVLVRQQYAGDPTFYGIKVLYTIHNLGYQGVFSRANFVELGLDRGLFQPSALEHLGDMNWMKAGILFSDAINTVSRRYAEEIQTPEHGFTLDALLRSRAPHLTGILNGVDYREWNPETDPLIPSHYSASELAGKADCKRTLLQAFGLPAAGRERPLIGIVSRFAAQKGFDLIAAQAEELMGEDIALVALGTGEPQYEEVFKSLAARFPDRVGVKIAYDNRLAHMIEAGADMFLMPSRYEPCGLNQIYSLRYGTPPIVRATGGLDDTIEDGTGFKFHEYSGSAMMAAIRSALRVFRNPGEWQQMMRRGMQKDFSWDASAAEYRKLYRKLTQQD